MDELCEDPDNLVKLLAYHVVPGVVPSSQLPSGKSYFETLLGKDIMLDFTMPGTDEQLLTVNEDATVITIDVGTNNGMIHVIDSVLEVPAYSKGELR